MNTNTIKAFRHLLLLLIGIAVASPFAAGDTRVQEEINSPGPVNVLKEALGETVYSEAMASGDYRYVGNLKCRLCHREFFLGRKKDPHDYAMEALVEHGYEDKPRCLACHSTGYMVPTGFTNLEDTPRLANVQCEGCHGPGNVHIKIAKRKKTGGGFLAGADNPDRVKKMCQNCHTDRWNRSYDDLESAYVKYRHAIPE